MDSATAVVGEADSELTCVTLIYHSSGPIFKTPAQSMKSPSTLQRHSAIKYFVPIIKASRFPVRSAFQDEIIRDELLFRTNLFELQIPMTLEGSISNNLYTQTRFVKALRAPPHSLRYPGSV